MGPTETQPARGSETPDAAAGPEPDELRDNSRIQRALRNLAFKVEQQDELVRKELSTVLERLDQLDARLDPGGGDEPEPEPRRDPEELREIKALRRQIAELHRVVAELRRAELGTRPRARRFRRSKTRKEQRRSAREEPPQAASAHRPAERPRAAIVAPQAEPRRGDPRSLRRFGRKLRRLPRRTRLRMLRVYRHMKAIIRQRLFARRLGSLNHHAPKELKIPRRYRREIKLSNPPTISIVTPSYNQGRFLERTILSVVDQDYPKLEYIVQDGGSADETGEILDRHADRLHHHEMRKDEGQADAINLGFEHASGDVMAYLNSDDVLLPGSLHYVARYFERHPEVDVVYGHRVLIDEDDMEIGRWVMPHHDDDVLSWADFVPQETMFWRRGIWEQAGGAMDKSWFLILDWDLIVRFRDAGANFKRLPRFLGGFRIHEVQKTSAVMDSKGKVEFAALRERCVGREVTRQDVRKAVGPYLRRHHLLQKMYRARLLRY